MLGPSQARELGVMTMTAAVDSMMTMARPDSTNEEVCGHADDVWTAPVGGTSLLGRHVETGLVPSGEYS